MAVPYTTRFAYLARTETANVQVYIAPPGIRAIVRDIVLSTGPVGPQVFNIYVAVPGSGNYTLTYQSLPGFTSYHLEMRQAMNPDDELWAYVTGTSWTLAITGYELSLPA